MALIRPIKKDREVARLRQGPLVGTSGVRIRYLYLPREGQEGPAVGVAIRVSKRCHRGSVERNRIRRWVREALREWFKARQIPEGKRLLLLITVCVRGGSVDFHWIRGTLGDLLGQVEVAGG